MRLAEEMRLRLEAVFDATGFGVLQVDRSDGIAYANRAAAETLGFSVERLIGQDKHALLHRVDESEDDGSQACPLRESVRTGKPYFGHDSFRRSDGTRVPIVVSTAPLSEPRGSAIVAFRDRSEALARESMSSEHLELISHELRSPLTSIVGFSRRLARATDEGRLAATEDQTEEIALLAREAERMRQTVTVLLGLARVDTGRVDVAPGPVALRPLIDDEIARIARAEPRMTVIVRGDADPTVDTDERIVGQVIHALLENAAKYSGPEPRVEIELVEGEAETLIVVTDSGPGIPWDMHAKLFARFERGQTSGSPRGLGLGLYMASQVADAAGAELILDAGFTDGARFQLRLPNRYTQRVVQIKRWSW